MGNLTPILIRNDFLHALKDERYQKEICEEIYKACCMSKESTISFSCYGNPMESLGYEHNSVPRLIVIQGNTCVDLSRAAYMTRDISEDEEFIKDCLKTARAHVKALENKLKKKR